MNLNELAPGETGVIIEVDKSALMIRLCDLGLIEYTPVECLFRAPLGGLSAYLIRGGAIALRDDDAARITIEKQADSTVVKSGGKCKHSQSRREVYYE